MYQSTVIICVFFIFYILVINFASGKDQLWSSYIEPEGKFELKYPGTWLTGESFNETSEGGLKFYASSEEKNQSNDIMQIGIGHRNPELVAPGMNLNTTLKLDSVLFMRKFKDDFQNFSLLMDPDFNKYTIDGHKAFSFEFSFAKNDLLRKGLFVATDINNSIFYVLFTPDKKGFDLLLQIMKNVISSVKIKNI